MRNRRTLTALSGAAITALLLSGCSPELISADDQCAQVVADPYPDLMLRNLVFNESGDVFDSSFDVDFEFGTEGIHEGLHAYGAYPDNPYEDLIGGGEFPADTTNGLYLVQRYNSELVISKSEPHQVSIPSESSIAYLGIGSIPIAVIVTCNEGAYSATLPTASPTAVDDIPRVDLDDASITQLVPGYSEDHAEVSVSRGIVDLNFPSDQDIFYTVGLVVPWAEGYGDVEDLTFERGWWASVISAQISSGVDTSSLNVASLGIKPLDFSNIDPDVLDEYEEVYLGSDMGPVTDAMLVLISVEQIDETTAQFRYSYHPASFDSNGLLTEVGPQTIDYAGPQYNDDQLKGGPGEQVTLTGSNMLVNSVRIGGQNARIVSNTSTQLTIEIPAGLTAGRYNVDLGFNGGSVTRQLGATVIDHSVWTKRIAPTQAKLYAKNVVGVGKVRFVLNGSEIAWVNAVDANDPKLRKVGIANYLVRTVNLKAGKNVLEIYVDGTREQRTVYTR